MNETGDTPSYIVDKNLEDVIKNLLNELFTLFQCFHDNRVKGNPDKCYLKHRWQSFSSQE